jgi:hypothetical protein
MQVVRVVVVGPSDAAQEKSAAISATKDLNLMLHSLSVLIEARLFETHVPAGMHSHGPQGLADEKLGLEKADYVVVIFKQKFGSPVWDSDSGTAHEMKLCYASWMSSRRPQIMFYTSQTIRDDMDQDAVKIRSLRDACPEIVWKTYSDLRHLQSEVMTNLGSQILSSQVIKSDGLPVVCTASTETAIVRKEGTVEAANSIELTIKSRFRGALMLRMVLYLNTSMELYNDSPDSRPYVVSGSSITFATREKPNAAAFTNVPVTFDHSGTVSLTIENVRFNAATIGESGLVIGHMKAAIVDGDEIDVLPSMIPIARVFEGFVFTTRNDVGLPNVPISYHGMGGLNQDLLETSGTNARVAYLQFTEGFPGAFKTCAGESLSNHGRRADSATRIMAAFVNLEKATILVSQTDVAHDGTPGENLLLTRFSPETSNVLANQLPTSLITASGLRFTKIKTHYGSEVWGGSRNADNYQRGVAVWEWTNSSVRQGLLTVQTAVLLIIPTRECPAFGKGTVHACLAPVVSASVMFGQGTVPRFLDSYQGLCITHGEGSFEEFLSKIGDGVPKLD